ncbi:unnamed protein product [Alopecurus aequalis]
MSHKRPLGAVAPEEHEAPQSPRKRLRRTVLAAVFSARICAPGRRRARAVTLEQMVRQAQLDVANLFFLLMVLVARLTSMEGLLLDLPNLLQRSIIGPIEDTIRSAVWTEIQGFAEQFATFQRSVLGSIDVLRTEIQERQAASVPNDVYQPLRDISDGLPETGGSSEVFKLRFVDVDRPKDPLYTGCPVQWQNGQKAKVAIFRNGKQIMGGDLSKLQIEILPVHADFCTERGLDDFTKEEFNKHIYLSKGKESVLTTVNLTNGEAYLDSFFFKDSSYNTNLRLAARVKRQDPAVRVQEAITDRFVVKVGRSESNEKCYLPSKGDAVHRLKKICQNGKYCIALARENITTVKHLMRQYHKDKSGLQKLIGMRKGDWSTMIEHASKCYPGDEIYSYRVAEENFELLFNDLYDLVGVIINGSFIPVRDLDQFQQIKVNSWKMSAYKKFDDQENSGGLVPDYLMRNDHPVRAVPLNNEAGPSEQARTTCQYPTDMATQYEFGEQHPFQQQNGISLAEVLSNNDAGPSKQKAPLFSQHTALQVPLNNEAGPSEQARMTWHYPTDTATQHGGSLTGQQNGHSSSLTTDALGTSCPVTAVELGQHPPPMPQNGIPDYPTQGNILSGQGPFSGQPISLSHILLPAPGASLIDQQNGYLSSLITHAPGTSYPVTDGLNQGTSSLNHEAADIWSGLSPIEDFLLQVNLEDQGFVQYNDELPNSNI